MLNIRKIAISLLSVVFVVPQCQNTLGSNIVLDFDEFQGMYFLDNGNPIPDSAKLSDQYLLSSGVIFSSGSPYVAVVEGGLDHAYSGINMLGGSRADGGLTYSSEFPIVASFFDAAHPSIPAVTDFVSLRGDLWGSEDSVTLNAFDVSGNLLAQDTQLDSGGVLLSVSAPGIHSVQFIGTQEWSGVGIDDFTFAPVRPIPEPSAGVLLASALISMLAYVWRRRGS